MAAFVRETQHTGNKRASQEGPCGEVNNQTGGSGQRMMERLHSLVEGAGCWEEHGLQ